MPFRTFADRAKAAGYNGVEMNLPAEQTACQEMMQVLKDYGLQWIGQGYLPPASESTDAYLGRMQRYLEHLASFAPLFINNHTGKDFFEEAANDRAIRLAEDISQRTGVAIVHETHRGRFNYCAKSTYAYLTRFPELKLTADFSHWCCVSESLLEGQEAWVDEACQRAVHIHARVGYAQGAQVNHPAAPEHAVALEKHLGWWTYIYQLRKQAHAPYLTVTPEFGPAPYMPLLPYTQQAVASQWDINLYMKDLLARTLTDHP